jgi:hypothetical protein
MRDTIDMAREAGYMKTIQGGAEISMASIDCLKVFEALVRADQDERYKWDIHSCGPTCKRYACVAMREAVKAEREALLDLVDDYAKNNTDLKAAIRARGNT